MNEDLEMPPSSDARQTVHAQLEVLAKKLLGFSAVDAVQNRVKKAMLREALARTQGNYAQAARMLGVRRQAVQQMVARYDLGPWTESMRRGS
ncbi:MAG TPA: helix-turn-helix domain-containing protein [Polyangiaceae bacterium]|jgi:DNA-binding protein Fis|nr:helix-turn-helix domain-containing protein [Polyangiaceae bacterium]